MKEKRVLTAFTIALLIVIFAPVVYSIMNKGDHGAVALWGVILVLTILAIVAQVVFIVKKHEDQKDQDKE